MNRKIEARQSLYFDLLEVQVVWIARSTGIQVRCERCLGRPQLRSCSDLFFSVVCILFQITMTSMVSLMMNLRRLGCLWRPPQRRISRTTEVPLKTTDVLSSSSSRLREVTHQANYNVESSTGKVSR
jgi:hypothetical protein